MTENAAETQSFQFNIGVLRSQMTLQIHTRHASRLWYGRRTTKDKPGIMGLGAFMSITNKINIGSRQDDPYADMWMLNVEEKIDQTKALLGTLKKEIDDVFNSVPSTFSLSENLNIQPANLPVFAGSHLGYLAIYVLAQYDEIVRKALLAFHIALIHRAGLDHWLNRGDKYLRSLLAVVVRYHFSGVTRKDFVEGNAAAQAAIEKYGEVPQDIFDGTRRSRFSPPLRTNEDEDSDDVDEAITEEDLQHEANLTIVIPTESQIDAMEAEAAAGETLEESEDSDV